MPDYDPSSLPPIDSVEIVDLRHVEANRVSEYMRSAAAAPCAGCDAKTAEAIAQTWRELLPGDSMRCHTPPIGLRFYCNGQLHLEASICWQCHNLFGIVNDKEFFFAFDAGSPPAKKLLALAKQVLGDEVVGNG